jgi:hypothetical protein
LLGRDLGATADFIFYQMRPALVLLFLLALWIVYGMLVGVRGAKVTRRQGGELTLLAVGPLVLAAWATVAFGWASGPNPVRWPLYVLNAFAVSSVALSIYLWRRHGDIAPFSALAAVGSVLATALAWFIGLMAIPNDWL